MISSIKSLLIAATLLSSMTSYAGDKELEYGKWEDGVQVVCPCARMAGDNFFNRTFGDGPKEEELNRSFATEWTFDRALQMAELNCKAMSSDAYIKREACTSRKMRYWNPHARVEDSQLEYWSNTAETCRAIPQEIYSSCAAHDQWGRKIYIDRNGDKVGDGPPGRLNIAPLTN